MYFHTISISPPNTYKGRTDSATKPIKKKKNITNAIVEYFEIFKAFSSNEFNCLIYNIQIIVCKLKKRTADH